VAEIDRLNRLLMEHITENDNLNIKIDDLNRFFCFLKKICLEIQRKRDWSLIIREWNLKSYAKNIINDKIIIYSKWLRIKITLIKLSFLFFIIGKQSFEYHHE